MSECKTCKFFKIVQAGVAGCFRYPPTALPMKHPVTQQVMVQSIYPQVSEQNFCGEYQGKFEICRETGE